MDVGWVHHDKLTTIGLQRRHLPRDAGIQQWMRASLPGWRPGICMEILSARPRASTIGCGFVDDAAVQAERDHAIVAQLPEPSLWIPRPSGLLHPVADATSAKATRSPTIWSWPKPGGGGSQSRSATRSSTVLNRFLLREELIRALLARLEMQPYPRGGRLGRDR